MIYTVDVLAITRPGKMTLLESFPQPTMREAYRAGRSAARVIRRTKVALCGPILFEIFGDDKFVAIDHISLATASEIQWVISTHTQQKAIDKATRTLQPVRFGDFIAYPPGNDGIATIGSGIGVDIDAAIKENNHEQNRTKGDTTEGNEGSACQGGGTNTA
jgi:hypothetical protein